jgi:RNA polymerase sigma-70 factor (ECF subfamily)
MVRTGYPALLYLTRNSDEIGGQSWNIFSDGNKQGARCGPTCGTMGLTAMATDVRGLLQRWREGDDAALNDMAPLVYNELRRIARIFLAGQPGHTLQPTALVNQAWMKLFQNAHPEFVDRAHFLAVMARVMRQVLIDHARAAGAAKRWGGKQRVPWDASIELAGDDVYHVQVLELDRALQALAKESFSLARIIEMHYFGGMTAEEVAAVVDRSAEAVRHDIRAARAWLRREVAR